ncbi:MAG: hypothetical protein R3F54_19700 [Alphaproteobacteria bacterium]
MSNPLDQALDDAMTSVPDCLVAGFLDIATGVLVKARSAASQPQEVFDLVAAAAAKLFHDPDLAAIESCISAGSEADDDGVSCEEIVLVSGQLLYLLTRSKANRDHVAVVIARKGDNVGLVMAKSRRTIEALDRAA